MSTLDVVIRGGTVVTEERTTVCDVGIRDGRIVAIDENLGAAQQTIDACGKLVLPGGVDAHCHIAQKSSMGIETVDDFYSGGVSAACGGTTTFIPFAAQHRGDSLVQVVEDYHRRAESAFIDYAFHLIVSDPTEKVLSEELPALIRRGYTSFKIYLTYDALKLTDRQAVEVLAVAARERALTMVHAENHDAIAWLTSELLKAGHARPRFHAEARPVLAEREATHRAISLAEAAGASLLIVHVSSREAVEQIAWAQRRGFAVYAETCPQYLVLTSQDLDRPGFEGAKFMCSPPPRERSDQEALWDALRDGVIDVFSSDHAPYRFDDPKGKKLHGEEAPFHKIPNGVPSLEVRLPILFSEGVGKGRLSLERFVAVTATQPARTYGLYPTKGAIAVGADADIAIWDPDLEVTVTQSRLHDRMDYTPFEGMSLCGWPVVTLSRGETVWDHGEVKGAPGRGRFLERR